MVVTLGAGSVGVPAGQLRLGHFAARRWVATEESAGIAELFVGGEGLAHGAEPRHRATAELQRTQGLFLSRRT